MGGDGWWVLEREGEVSYHMWGSLEQFYLLMISYWRSLKYLISKKQTIHFPDSYTFTFTLFVFFSDVKGKDKCEVAVAYLKCGKEVSKCVLMSYGKLHYNYFWKFVFVSKTQMVIFLNISPNSASLVLGVKHFFEKLNDFFIVKLITKSIL